MGAQASRAPFCFKDPRFCYTLPAWRPFLAEPVFLCVFREPARTANSILKECQSADYLRGLAMSFAQAVETWALMYRHVLQGHRHAGEWLFFHYDQLLEDASWDKVTRALGVPVDRNFADARLKRSSGEGPVPPAALAVYEQLCDLARHRP
jgi:hypothetical protein